MKVMKKLMNVVLLCGSFSLVIRPMDDNGVEMHKSAKAYLRFAPSEVKKWSDTEADAFWKDLPVSEQQRINNLIEASGQKFNKAQELLQPMIMKYKADKAGWIFGYKLPAWGSPAPTTPVSSGSTQADDDETDDESDEGPTAPAAKPVSVSSVTPASTTTPSAAKPVPAKKLAQPEDIDTKKKGPASDDETDDESDEGPTTPATKPVPVSSVTPASTTAPKGSTPPAAKPVPAKKLAQPEDTDTKKKGPAPIDKAGVIEEDLAGEAYAFDILNMQTIMAFATVGAIVVGLRYLYTHSAYKQISELNRLEEYCAQLFADLSGVKSVDVDLETVECPGLTVKMQDSLDDAVASYSVALRELQNASSVDRQVSPKSLKEYIKVSSEYERCKMVIGQCKQALAQEPTLVDRAVTYTKGAVAAFKVKRAEKQASDTSKEPAGHKEAQKA